MRTLWVTSWLTTAALLATGCAGTGSEPTAERVVEVKVITAGGSSHGIELRHSGTVEAEKGTSVSFATGGTITDIKVGVGDRVRKGQLMATIDPRTARDSHNAAKAMLRQAQDAYDRMAQLHDKGSLPEIQWVEVNSKLEQAMASESMARKSLDDCNLLAPSDGVVAEKNAEPGQNTLPGVAIFKLVRTSELNVEVSVPEGEIAGTAIGQRVHIEVPALGGKAYDGRVVERGVTADPISRSYTVKVRVEGADGSLLPGMVASVGMGGEGRDEIVIPARLVQLADDNANFVWVDAGGRAERRTVTTGEFRADGVVVTGGLAEGDKVIAEGQQKVCNGTKLIVRE